MLARALYTFGCGGQSLTINTTPSGSDRAKRVQVRVSMEKTTVNNRKGSATWHV